MLATTIESPQEINLRDPALLYEPKLDGIRGLILIEPAQPSPRISIWSRNGNDKTHQFPEVVRGLKEFGKRLRVPVILDGEIVALTELGEPAGFQRLQGRMHLTGERDIARSAAAQGAAFIAFDVLRDGAQDLRPLPLTDRRARLERVFGSAGASSTVRIGDFVASDGRRLYQTAIARGWEGLIVKVADSIYESGRRSRAWRKLKLVKQQEFVIGGWTDPRETRTHFGALLLGVYEPGTRGDMLRYVGHTGTGFTHQELARIHAMLKARATDKTPFSTKVASNEHPHWVRPELVCQVKFSEWTDEQLLRHPVYLGLRDDIDPKKIRIEPQGPPLVAPIGSNSPARGGSTGSNSSRVASEASHVGDDDDAGSAEGDEEDVNAAGSGARSARKPRAAAAAAASSQTRTAAASRSRADGAAAGTDDGAGGGARKTAASRRISVGDAKTKARAGAKVKAAAKGTGRIAKTVADERALLAVVDELQALENAKRDGTIALPDGTSADVTNPAKVFWPTDRITKGELLRFYVRVSPWLLPAVEDRPLVMKRFPNGVTAKPFYQQRAPDAPPPGVRTELTEESSEESGLMPRFVGGNLATLLYMTQLAAISQDPWFSRVQSPGFADYVALDLDPMPGVPFSQVLDVARYVHDELESLHIPGVPKTSGSSGLHIYIPLPPRTTYESGLLLCHIVATMVAMKHGRIATVERSVAKRGRKVYVDYLQNIEGKTLATAYCVRASEFAGVSTPLTWDEVHAGVEPQDFTIRTVLPRFEQLGDLWAPIRTSPPVDLRGTLTRLASAT
jgi:bifunctional non-homologous end joining protein LigD